MKPNPSDPHRESLLVPERGSWTGAAVSAFIVAALICAGYVTL